MQHVLRSSACFGYEAGYEKFVNFGWCHYAHTIIPTNLTCKLWLNGECNRPQCPFAHKHQSSDDPVSNQLSAQNDDPQDVAQVADGPVKDQPPVRNGNVHKRIPIPSGINHLFKTAILETSKYDLHCKPTGNGKKSVPKLKRRQGNVPNARLGLKLHKYYILLVYEHEAARQSSKVPYKMNYRAAQGSKQLCTPWDPRAQTEFKWTLLQN
ncbi:hypothetical protein EV424DRAFT_1351150 [Suillus variegatus]|nr:hypothetical protein EV424DRAFT_1351150 [Suillus variegatus]